MRVLCIGSINADHIYGVPHLPLPGETLSAIQHVQMLGGKGANQSIAAARAGGQVAHVGAVGPDGDWLIDALRADRIDVSGVARLQVATGHARVCVDPEGENSIVLAAGSNRALTEAQIDAALQGDPGVLLLQNEVNLAAYAARQAKAVGWTVLYSAAPFSVDALAEVAPFADYVLLNAVEAAQFQSATGTNVEMVAPKVLITRGAQGCTFFRDGQGQNFAAPKVTPVDTTGAGDTFAGVFAQGLAGGLTEKDAIARAQIAAAIQVTRPGTSAAMPTANEINSFQG